MKFKKFYLLVLIVGALLGARAQAEPNLKYDDLTAKLQDGKNTGRPLLLYLVSEEKGVQKI